MSSRVVLRGFSAALLAFSPAAPAEEPAFRRLQLSAEYHSEGADSGDFNRDGKRDVTCGPYWYAGPDFKARTAMYPAGTHPEEGGYADHFFSFVRDFSGDGWDDVLVIGFPGTDCHWYENPGAAGGQGPWKKHLAMKVVDNESPHFSDLDGDKLPELVCTTGGRLVMARPDPQEPRSPWRQRFFSKPKGHYQRFTHGFGVGDVNGDGRKDLLLADGWYEQPPAAALESDWAFHPFAFAAGGAQIHCDDVDGDGDADVVTSHAAHGFGLAWYEQKKDASGAASFEPHWILSTKAEEKLGGVQFSQLHAVALADLDGDGRKDLITGKCRYAHGPNADPEPQAPPVLYWFRHARGADGKVSFEPRRLDDNSGVGRQISLGDLDGDGRLDIVIGNKRGAFVFLQEARR